MAERSTKLGGPVFLPAKRRRTEEQVLSIDLSLVLPAHRDARYLPRTLLSLGEAAAHARDCGLETELVAILDRADEPTRQIVEAFDSAAFTQFQVASVDYGSLGLARNHGLRLAQGDYVGLCDADDLISFNMLVEMHRAAERVPGNTILVPQYIVAFGEEYHVGEFLSSDEVTPLSFIDVHPFSYQAFFSRSHIGQLVYSDVPLSESYAYEDWHFNAEALAKGFKLRPVPDTVHFYRKKRRGSLLGLADAASVRQIPPSRLFHPAVYRQVCQPFYEGARRSGEEAAVEAGRPDFAAAPNFPSLLAKANHIDPEVDADLVYRSRFFRNTERTDLKIGCAYYALCEATGDDPFSDLVLLTTGDLDPLREGYAKAVVNRLLDEGRRVLLLVEGASRSLDWPASASGSMLRIVHLHHLGIDISEYGRDVLILKMLQWCGADASFHVFQGHECHRFVHRMGPVLRGRKASYYVFEQRSYERDGLRFVERDPFHFISENIDYLDAVLTPQAELIEFGTTRLVNSAPKWRHAP